MENKLKEIAELLRTQDGRITHAPIFAVQQKRRVWGMDSEYCDDYVWMDVENPEYEATEEEVEKLENDEDESDSVDGVEFEKAYYVDHWDFVTSFLTEKACLQYIKDYHYNLNEPRSYAYSGYRNSEWELIRKYLMENF